MRKSQSQKRIEVFLRDRNKIEIEVVYIKKSLLYFIAGCVPGNFVALKAKNEYLRAASNKNGIQK